MSKRSSDQALEFWSCKCPQLFVHRETVTYCPRCEADVDSSRSSTVAEVVDQLGISEDQVERRSK